MKKNILIITATGLLLFANSCKPTKHLSMDIVATNNKTEIIIDQNLLLKNPMWYYQTLNKPAIAPCDVCPCQSPDMTNWSSFYKSSANRTPCTTDSVYYIKDRIEADYNVWPFHVCDDATGEGCYTCKDGLGAHINWFPVTYECSAYWEGKSNDPITAPDLWNAGDSDYNLRLVRDDKALYSNDENDYGLIAEFFSNETIDNWDGTDTWWEKFHNAVDDNFLANFELTDPSTWPSGFSLSDPSTWPTWFDPKTWVSYTEYRMAKNMMNKHFSIVMGLVGLDCEHGCYTEIHPVYAMFVHVKDDPNDDRWSFFVRNSGTEGGCGFTNQTYNAIGKNNQFRIVIPHDSTVGIELISHNVHGINVNPESWDIQMQFSETNGGTTMSFNLGDPKNHPCFVGDITIKWKPVPGKTLQPRNDFNLYPQLKPTRKLKETENDESFKNVFSERINKLDSVSKKELSMLLEQSKPKINIVKISPKTGTSINSILPSKQKTKKMKYNDTMKLVEDTTNINKIKREYEIIDLYLKSKGIN